MWTSCCFVTKRRSNLVHKSPLHAATVFTSATQQLGNSAPYVSPEKSVNDLTANGFQPRQERRSLPDVVITSASMAPTKACILTKPNLQIDNLTGRRPTLDVETTARLAEAESIGFDELAGSDAPQMKSTYRSKSLGAAQLSKQVYGIPQTRASTSNDAPKPGTSVDKNSKKYSLMRLSTIKRLQKHLRKLGSLKLSHAEDRVESEELTGYQSPSLCQSRDSHVLEEEDDLSSEKNSVEDRLGQLPPKSFSRNSRLTGYSTCEGVCRSINMLDKLNTTYGTGARPGGIRRGSLCIFSQMDEPIVTPFAQILASLRRVRANFILLTNVHSSKE
ncbi:Phosphodiesterase [Fasciolopsis buskii]|uniref:3',5'-cyclic-AMP phosphodiesterase n=1 Tax=Fasciolopsis buskii TaxID=27845 RepID=A0A8E0RM90_9TREM|nr:Phosphodiesterase [Fasciolopsis buski]